jgi:hypothetical protein
MKIVEYKKHLINGCLVDPEFIIDGGVFNDPTNNTWIGKVLDESHRKYYIPDTLTELSRNELIERVLSLNIKKLSDPNNPHSPIVTIDEFEIMQLVDNWVSGGLLY